MRVDDSFIGFWDTEINQEKMSCILDDLSNFLVRNDYARMSPNKAIEITAGGKAICSLLTTALCLAVYFGSAIMFLIFSKTYK